MRFERTFIFWAMLLSVELVASPPAKDSARVAASFRSDNKPREVRNYIRPCLYLDYFSIGSHALNSDNIITDKIGKYSFSQTNLGFYAPLYTNTHPGRKDTNDVNSFQLLFTADLLSVRPEFSNFTTQHHVYKMGAGLRGIWAFNSKNVIFAEAFPFITGDRYGDSRQSKLRLGSTFVFNRMVNPSFSWRVGITKSFLFGNRHYLPMIGFRVGKLDGPVYFTMQLPRFTALYIQPGPKLSISIYSRAYGGLYALSNSDSLYNGLNSKVYQLGQTGIANGIRLDVRLTPWFNFYVSSGVTVQNHFWLYSFSFNQQNGLPPLRPFYNATADPSFFFHFGLTFRIGQAKKSAGNYLMYDAFDLNTTLDPGDNNSNPGNGDITPQYKKKEMQKVQYKDVVDLVDESDLY